eukprot:g55653.t1
MFVVTLPEVRPVFRPLPVFTSHLLSSLTSLYTLSSLWTARCLHELSVRKESFRSFVIVTIFNNPQNRDSTRNGPWPVKLFVSRASAAGTGAASAAACDCIQAPASDVGQLPPPHPAALSSVDLYSLRCE